MVSNCIAELYPSELYRHLRRHLLILCLVGSMATAMPATGQNDPFAEAREYLDAGRAAEAVAALDSLLGRNSKQAEGFLLRSTGYFMLGERQAGVKDLDRALELDPSLRQAWLNRAALYMSDQSYKDAYEALLKAKELDPTSQDNDLNIGVALLLQGELQAASKSFESYLTQSGDRAESFYLVATNYAMAGYAAFSIQHLKNAILIDEKTRLRARTDPNFGALSDDVRFQEILNTDLYRQPPGAFVERRQFENRYNGGAGELLGAVIDALRRQGVPFNPRVEVTHAWALIWGELRIKIEDDDRGYGAVELSAPATSLTPGEWQQRTDELFQQIRFELTPKVLLPNKP